MVFNINRFSSDLNNWGLAKQSHYDVLIMLPPALQLVNLDLGGIQEHMAFRAENAEFPGRAITTTENKIYGPQRKLAYGVIYDDTSMTFSASHNMREKVLFEQWMEFISGQHQVFSEQSTFNVAYYKDYVTDIFIKQYSVTGQETYGIKLNEAFPVSITAIPLARDSQDYHKITVNFAYRTWERLPTWEDKRLPVADNTSFFSGIIPGLLGAGTAVLGSRLPPRTVQIFSAIGTSIRQIGSVLGNII